jgi:glycosyltransferase involved in cell wall biosynthesis
MRTVRLINALGDAYRHSILAIDGRTGAAAELAPGADARLLPSLPRAGTPQTVRALRGLITSEAPDLVLSYNWGAFDSVLASRLLLRGRKHLHHEDGFNADEAQAFKGRRIWARKLLLPGIARVVVPSNTLLRVALERWRLGAERVQLIPNGIDLAGFTARDGNPELRAKLGIAPDVPVVGFVGHLRPVKNPVRLVQAFARLRHDPSPELLMLGQGEEREAVEEAARSLGVSARVHLLGHRSDTAPWYRAMDVFAISSDSEQMPVALLEAMASSLPVASTDVGDVSEMLAPAQRPFVVRPESAGGEGLWSALQGLLDAPVQRATLGAANRTRAEERYSFERMLAGYRELYESALRGRRA